MRKVYIAGKLEILGSVNDEFEDLMTHVHNLMGDEVEQLIRGYACPMGLECPCNQKEDAE